MQAGEAGRDRRDHAPAAPAQSSLNCGCSRSAGRANTSWSIGEAMPMMPMPAVTFMHSTDQISQNCGVLTAFVHVDVPRGDHGVAVGGGRRPAVAASSRARHLDVKAPGIDELK
jgi:hypothetical protein